MFSLRLAHGLLFAGLVKAAPQYQIGLDETTVASVRNNLLNSANLSWELGTAAQALLELDYTSLSVYNDSAYPPPTLLDENDPRYPHDVFYLIDKVIHDKPSDIEPLIEDGAVGDPASLGVGVLLRNWTRTNTSNTIYSFYAGEQADYLIHGAPHTRDGACSQRNEQVQLWSDFVAMAPPFLAYFGATLGGPNGTWLMQYAFDQCRLYRQYLRDEVGLWRHVVLGDWADNTHWATGNAWAASGMIRTLEAIKRSPTADQLMVQQQNLTTWVKEILDGAWPKQQANGTLLNVLDAMPQTTFADTSSTALITAVTFRYAVLTNDSRHVDSAVRAMELVTESVDGQGWLRGTVDPYTFNQPLAGSGNDRGSPEGQAFVLQMHAAWRDYLAAGGTYNASAVSTATGTDGGPSPIPSAVDSGAVRTSSRLFTGSIMLSCTILMLIL